MNCGQMEQWFGRYWDLPADAPERREIDRHLAECEACAEEFRLWEESAALIREMPQVPDEPPTAASDLSAINQKVMSRIYAEQSWFMPAVRRTYSFTPGFRLRVAAIVTALLSIFVCGFLYTVVDRLHGEERHVYGVIETANTFSSGREAGGNLLVDVPVASLSNPIALHVSPVMPEYWVALSLLGMIMTLLILNWLTRVRA